MSGGHQQYDMIFNSRINIDWDEKNIDQLGRKLTDLSGKVDLSKFDTSQQEELKKYGIESVSELFEQNNGQYQLSQSLRALGSDALPSVIREIQTFGRALTDMTKAGKTYSAQLEADSKTATAYRAVVNSGGILKDLMGMKFSTQGTEAMYGDVARMVQRRFDQLSRQSNEVRSRGTWEDALSKDTRLRTQIATVAERRGLQLDGDTINELIHNGVISLGTRSKIENRRALFAPLYQHKAEQSEPSDVFGNKDLRDLFKSNGISSAPKYKGKFGEAEDAYSKGIFEAIRKLQMKGS